MIGHDVLCINYLLYSEIYGATINPTWKMHSQYVLVFDYQIQTKSDVRESTAEIRYPVFVIHDDSHDNPEEIKKSNQATFLEHLAKVRERHQKVRDRVNRIKQEEVKMLKEAKQE